MEKFDIINRMIYRTSYNPSYLTPELAIYFKSKFIDVRLHYCYQNTINLFIPNTKSEFKILSTQILDLTIK